MGDERAVTLDRIARDLTGPSDPARVIDDAVVLGQLRVEVEFIELEAHSAHVHIFACVPQWGPDPLDACVLGHGDTVDLALADAAATWTRAVGRAILSAASGSALGGAEWFDGSEPATPLGRAGIRGPLWPRVGEVDPAVFATAPLFADHELDLADKGPHLIKAVLFGQRGVWRRTLELDGHLASHTDAWPEGPPAPSEPAVVVQYVVLPGLGPAPSVAPSEPARDRGAAAVAAVDTVRRALPVFLRGGAMEDAALHASLVRAGFPHDLATELIELVPIACFRARSAGAGYTFSPHYQRQLADGSTTPERPLAALPLYVAALEVARGAASSRQVAVAAARSAEAGVARSLGSAPGVVFTPVRFASPPPAVPGASSSLAPSAGLPERAADRPDPPPWGLIGVAVVLAAIAGWLAWATLR